MAYRYRQIYPQNGEVLNPQDWNLNHAELASEFNGYLDRDNLPDDSIGTSRVESGTFVKIHSIAYEMASLLAISDESVQWVRGNSLGDIATLDIECQVDAVLEVEFSATFAFLLNEDIVGIRFRATVDGTLAAMSGWFSAGNLSDSVYIVGAIPVTVGTRSVLVECQTAAVPVHSQDFYKNDVVTIPYVGARELVVIEKRR